MVEHKFTDEEIIKALECCANADCLNCPRWSEEWVSGMCNDFLPTVLDLINRQKAKIKSLTKILYELKMETEMVYKQRDCLLNRLKYLEKYTEGQDNQ